MRIGRKAASRAQFVAKVAQLFLGEPALEESAGVDPRGRVGLEVYLVPVAMVVPAAEKVIESHLVQGGRRGVGGEMAADGRIAAVGADHHDHGVPAQNVADAALEVVAARERRLQVGWNGIDVGSVAGGGNVDPRPQGMGMDLLEEVAGSLRTAALQDVVEGLEPFRSLYGFL